ncbi:outer dynein arm-docking complex subunit 3-like [Portunus trituberculatus]|uniref:outer dynein arm-docking complex subunit 3-like n=1 Tax=Portunus trituberculatus TaxID=210409 RepID=UPI001E1CFF55|nr:outer dynein arm-docking complex subunit 3-like [Portunus trituberculatus]
MPSIAEQKAKVNSQIQDLRKKIQLSEGESKAFYEESEGEKRANKAAIIALRAEIKLLHIKIQEAKQGSERSVERVLQQRSSGGTGGKTRGTTSAGGKSRGGGRGGGIGGGRSHSSGGVSGGGGGGGGLTVRVKRAEDTITATQYRLHDQVKRLNFLHHTRSQREDRLATLKALLGEATSERAQLEQSSIQELQQELIGLENELERVGVNVSEAEGVRRRYSAMVTALRGEAAAHRTTLDQLHVRLAQEKEALMHLRESRKKAEKTRDSLRTRLHQEEECAYETKREREKRLSEYRRRAEERRVLDLGTAADRRLSLLRSPPTRRDSPSAAPLTPHDAQEMVEAELEKYQQVFTKLKDVLGVTSVDEVVERLTTQGNTREHLRQLRSVTLEEVTRLKQEKETMHEELHRVKYTTTEDAARMVEIINELRQRKEEQARLKEELATRLDGTMKVLTGVRAGLEHIAEKLESPEEPRPARSEVNSPLEYLVLLMEYNTRQADILMQQISDAAHLQHKLAEMQEEEKENGGILTSPENIRVSFPGTVSTKAAQQQVEEGADSGEEEETLTRKFIKRQAQMIVEAKARKRNRPVSTFKS